MSQEFEKLITKIYEALDKRPGLSKILTAVLLTVFAGIGIYLRALPAIKWGLELHANDPWIEYWQTNYTYYHGLLSWYTLTPSNPATHLFWYPWGRNFLLSAYPGIPIWTALTYYVVGALGITVKAWVALQPLVFAGFTFVTLFFAVREIMDGSNVAGLMAALLYALVPAASDRTIVGFVEKEGVAMAMVFLFIYFYSRLMKTYKRKDVDVKKKMIYLILAALSMASVGWFWGGFLYVWMGLIVFMILYPLFAPKEITPRFLKYNIALILLSLILSFAAPTVPEALGFFPRFNPKGIGVLALASLVLPIIYYVLGNSKYFKKKILTPARYFLILFFGVIAGVVLAVKGIIPVSGRLAWALGLRFVHVSPLVESVAEQQPALVAKGLTGLFTAWGTGIYALFFVSPLILAIIGAFYLLYKGRADRVYLALAFLIAFYAYMNATYFEATAATYGLAVAGCFLGWLFQKFLPSRKEIMERKRGRVSFRHKSSARIIAFVFVVLALINLAAAGAVTYNSHIRMVPSIMAGGAPVNARTNAWYDTLKFLEKNTARDALIVAWWDYGYWISVGAHRATLADGATLNGTQISLLAKILTAYNETEAVKILKELKAPENQTYILVFDVFRFIPGKNNTITVVPIVGGGTFVGLVDLPKSYWMVRIAREDVSKYFYLYIVQSQRLAFLSPRFDEPNKLPLIYKIMVDGILYLNYEDKNHTYYFVWYTGNVQPVSPEYQLFAERVGIKYQVTVTSTRTLSFIDRPQFKYFEPYKVIAEPYQGLPGYYEVIFIYKAVFSGVNRSTTG